MVFPLTGRRKYESTSVILYLQKQISFLVYPAGNGNQDFFRHIFCPMDDCIFRKRLHHKARHQALVCLRGDLEAYVKRVPVSYFLNGKIVRKVFKLLGKWDEFLGLHDGIAQQGAQGGDAFRHRGHIVDRGHPLDRVQRVEQKMGINLVLEVLQL